MSELGFISEKDFKKHVQLTIRSYGKKLESYDLKKFNKNLVDPIKLIFDKTVYNYSWEELVKNEVFRQRDKSANNDIGYFHQHIFQYVSDCVVPKDKWDVIFTPKGGLVLPEGERVKTVYVEMKNKHNTMNSSASAKTYERMKDTVNAADNCACFLVETIAKQSQNKPWAITIGRVPHTNDRIRRVSIDEFYSIVTGRATAFYDVCMKLPGVIEDIMKNSNELVVPKDTVVEELREKAVQEKSFEYALYLLGFDTYKGFNKK